ncbi:toprim domain-containing protein [Legionella genomosp. 1]|uniref:toprim domain-containing protein n=1 Tax=Legionella genomosp. 1 TaxID=1093625 RepID=UPI001055DD1D|nr:toprim domain-containing protein [Legionella genomosp. 1]
MKQSVEVSRLIQKQKDNDKVRLAQKLWKKSEPIEGTAAELYLTVTRKIPAETVKHLEFRYLKGPLNIASFDNNQQDDYLIAPVYNLDDQLVGLQIIQLDAHGNKAQAIHVDEKDYYCKRYLGAGHPSRPGKAALVNKGRNPDFVFIAEGVETAASIAAIPAIRDNFSILASMGVNELPATLGYIKTHFPPNTKVVLLKDHDKPEGDADIAFRKAHELFESAGYQVIIKEPVPKSPDTDGYDWNDLLIDGGVDALESQFDWAVSSFDEKEERSVNDSFRKLYTQLLVSENISEEQQLVQLLTVVINQQISIIKGRPFGEYFSSDPALNRNLLSEMDKKIDEIMLALKYVQKLSSPNTLPRLPDVVTRFVNALIQLKHERAQLQSEAKEDNPKAERTRQQTLDDAYNFVLVQYNHYLTDKSDFPAALVPEESEDFNYYYANFLRILPPSTEKKPSFESIRQLLRLECARLEKEIKSRCLEQTQRHLEVCFQLKNDAVIGLIIYLKSIGSMLNLKKQELDGKMDSETYRAYQKEYLALYEKAESINDLEVIQQWLNNLEHFNTLPPLKYQPPHAEDAHEVEFLYEEENQKESLEALIQELFDNIPLEEVEDKEKGKEIEKEADPFEQAVNDYVMELAVNLYKSFEVFSPCKQFQQEFDGLALRDGRLTIIERKTNDGTGPGVLQRNFCQQKILSKEQFVGKNWLPEIFSNAHPESFIDIEIPAMKDWYCPEFTNEIQDMLILSAKLTVIKALKDMRLEFNLNRPQHYTEKGYQGVFFNSRLLGDVKVRFSEHGLGNEERAHRQLDELKSSMSQHIGRSQ